LNVKTSPKYRQADKSQKIIQFSQLTHHKLRCSLKKRGMMKDVRDFIAKDVEIYLLYLLIYININYK